MEQTGRTTVIIVLPGSAAAFFQVIALREFMAVFSGNELDLGIALRHGSLRRAPEALSGRTGVMAAPWVSWSCSRASRPSR